MDKNQELLFIEECFADIKNKEDVNGALKKMSSAINRLFYIKCDVIIVENKTKELFGMSVYPKKISDTDKMIHLIVTNASTTEIVKTWQEVDEWIIEIDSIALYDVSTRLNPQELTAMLLHEIGHVRYSNSVPVRLSKILKTEIASSEIKVKALIADKRMYTLFILPILDACQSKKYSYTNRDRKEVKADMLVVKYGYGDSLNSLIDKLITTNASTYITKNDRDLEKETEVMTNWVIINIKGLEFRKNNLRSALVVQKLKTPSTTMKSALNYIYDRFFSIKANKLRTLLSESTTGVAEDKVAVIIAMDELDKYKKRIVNESFLSLFDGGKLKKVTQSDIDILRVEVDKIENNDDKIYMLDKINRTLELVNTGLEFISTGREKKVPQSKNTLKDFAEQLNKLRSQVLYVKVIDKEYGVFIKYPKGYEG